MGSDVRKKVLENFEYLVNCRRHFHMYPELSSHEYETAKYIKKQLDDFQIPYETTGETCIVATIQGNKSGKTVALRGDIDALPIQEATGVEFTSKNDGVMHACGHDCHITFMLGSAKILNELKDEIHGKVKIIFQEGEEIGAGARKIMATQLLESVDNIAGLHVSPGLDLGKFALGYGIQSSYGAGAKIKILGKGGDAAHPDKAVNALIVAGQIVTSISAAVAYEFPSNQQVVLVPTILKAGLGSHDIPKTADISYNFRTLNKKNLIILNRILENVPQNIARAFGAEATVEIWGPGGAVNNDTDSTDRAISVIRENFGDDSVIICKPFMGGEDFSLYQTKIPGVFAHVGGAVNQNYGALHTDTMLVDEEILKYGVEFLVQYAVTYLNETTK